MYHRIVLIWIKLTRHKRLQEDDLKHKKKKKQKLSAGSMSKWYQTPALFIPDI